MTQIGKTKIFNHKGHKETRRRKKQILPRINADERGSRSGKLRRRSGKRDMLRGEDSRYPIGASYVIGSASTASQPVRSERLESCKTPPWASAIWRLRIRPIPLPPCLVVKNGTKRLSLLRRPGPSSNINTSTLRALV